MGQEQSLPQQPSYQPDFLTAHVRKVSQQLAPKPTPTQLSSQQAPSAIGTDSLMVAHAKSASAAIHGSSGAQTAKAGSSYYAADTVLNQHVQKMAARASTPPQHTVNAPSVPVDSWLIREQKKAAAKSEHGVRNKFGLLPEKGTPEKIHQTADGYETDFAVQAKKLCPGPLQSNGRTFGPEMGQATGMKLDAYYVQFGKATHELNPPKKAPTVLAEWQGIRPHIPVADATRTIMKANEERIREANVPTPLPAPQMPTDAFMLQFSKDTALSPDPIRYEYAPPPNDFVPEASFAAVATPTKGEGVPDKSEYQGIKPALGSDSYMASFAKTVSVFTPSKLKGKETSKAPLEVTL